MRWIEVVLIGGVLGLGCAGDDSDSSGDTSSATAPTDPDASGPTSMTGSGSSISSTSNTGGTSGTASTTAGPTTATSDSGTMTGPGDSSETSAGSSTGGDVVEFMECADNVPGMECPDGLTCFPSECCFGLGFCVPAGLGTCGGFVGEECEGALVCVADACIGDATGACVSADFAEAVCETQTECWSFCGLGGG